MPITHAKVSGKSDGADATQIQPSDWNDEHVGGAGSQNLADVLIEGGDPDGNEVTGTLRIAPTDLAALGLDIAAGQSAVAAVDQVWQIYTDNAPTSGHFKLTFRGDTTAFIDYTATGSDIAAALCLLASVGATNCIAQAGHEGDTFTSETAVNIQFTNALGEQAVEVPTVTGDTMDNPITGSSESGGGAHPGHAGASSASILRIRASDGVSNVLDLDSDGTMILRFGPEPAANNFQIRRSDGDPIFIVEENIDGDPIIGFYGQTPTPRPELARPSGDAGDLWDVLQTLGLVAP